MINVQDIFLFEMPGGAEWVMIILILLILFVPLFLVIYYLTNLTRRNTVFGRILKEFIIALLVWVVVAVLLVGYGQGHLFLILFWISLVPFGYFFYLINLYWLIPTFERKKKRVSGYVVEIMAAAVIVAFPFVTIASSLNYYQSIGILIGLFIIVMMVSLAITWFIYLRNKEQIQKMLYLKKELGKSTADLQFLRSQINPHFLFNALNTLYGLSIKEHAIKTSDGIQRLGDMMRFMLQDNQKDRIPLGTEIHYLKNYIYIQQLRLAESENIQLTIDIDEPSHEYFIAPMLLIAFVENAFKHGVRLQEKSWIKVSLYEQNKVLHFNVRNSLHLQSNDDTEQNSTGIGLENVRERLNLLYPDKHHLDINKNAGEYIVHLTLNL
ncbi:MAG TPA: histidine kinase [Chitinophagaceae bacterium]|nr:histidine kinase [Chitinophagaceae bacterium]